jgi:hypothetical protein
LKFSLDRRALCTAAAPLLLPSAKIAAVHHLLLLLFIFY